MPESSSKVNQYMLRYIYRFAQPTLYKMTLVKALPSNISFDMKAYEKPNTDIILKIYGSFGGKVANYFVTLQEFLYFCSGNT